MVPQADDPPQGATERRAPAGTLEVTSIIIPYDESGIRFCSPKVARTTTRACCARLGEGNGENDGARREDVGNSNLRLGPARLDRVAAMIVKPVRLVALVLVAALASCGGGGGGSTPPTPPTPTPTPIPVGAAAYTCPSSDAASVARSAGGCRRM